jgi:hypothetical protein
MKLKGPLSVVLAFLVMLVTMGCGDANKKTYTADSHGGLVGPGGSLGLLDFPKDFVDGEIPVTFERGNPPATDTLAAFADPIGDPVAINPVSIRWGAAVRFPLDPAKDLPKTGGRRATVTNAFIAILDKDTNAWTPLPTQYDAGKQQLVASPPYYTWFRRYVINPASPAWTPTATGTTAVEAAGKSGSRKDIQLNK